MPADSLRPLPSRGIYLTEDGFRRVLLERNELLQCRELTQVKDSSIFLLRSENGLLIRENALIRTGLAKETASRQQLQKRYFWAHLERWAWRGVFAAAVIFQITK